jgi:hypothetical protein
MLKETLLSSYGFTSLTPEEFVRSPYRNSLIQAQWQYKEALLSVEIENKTIEYLFFDKLEPQFSLRFHTEEDFREIVLYLSKGKSIGDLLMDIQRERQKEITKWEEQRLNKPNLEDFRFNDIGGSYLTLHKSPDQKIFMAYRKHAILAFNLTLSDISILENATHTVHTGTQSNTALSLWFLTLESYVNTLIKLCCVKNNIAFKEFKNQDLSQRLTSLIKLLGLDIRPFNQNKIFAKLNEFTQFRNDIFHDRHFGEEVSFKHTVFSPIPIFSCQIDVIQAYLILLELSSMLRYVIPGLDTMPSVILQNEHVAVWEKLDIAYQKILNPYIVSVLEKHQLKTKLNLEVPAVQEFKSALFQNGEISCHITVDQEPEFDFPLNTNCTNFANKLNEDYLESLNYKPGTMRMDRVIIS